MIWQSSLLSPADYLSRSPSRKTLKFVISSTIHENGMRENISASSLQLPHINIIYAFLNIIIHESMAGREKRKVKKDGSSSDAF
jgi:hypothetical protein